jgi:hypothetical protein
MGDLMQDAVLLARARGGRNKRHSRRHALRLTLLGDFADENYPIAGRDLDESWTKSVRELADFYPKYGRGFNAGNPVQSHGQGWRRETHFGQGTRYPLKGQGVLCFASVARNASRDAA